MRDRVAPVAGAGGAACGAYLQHVIDARGQSSNRIDFEFLNEMLGSNSLPVACLIRPSKLLALGTVLTRTLSFGRDPQNFASDRQSLMKDRQNDVRRVSNIKSIVSQRAQHVNVMHLAYARTLDT